MVINPAHGSSPRAGRLGLFFFRWGHSSAGRAQRSQRWGRGFESLCLHHLEIFEASFFRRATAPDVVPAIKCLIPIITSPTQTPSFPAGLLSMPLSPLGNASRGAYPGPDPTGLPPAARTKFPNRGSRPGRRSSCIPARIGALFRPDRSSNPRAGSRRSPGTRRP